MNLPSAGIGTARSMRRGAAGLLVLTLMGPACSKDADLEGAYSGASFLTVVAMPLAGTTGTRGTDTVCSGALRIDTERDNEIRGSFDRLRCSGLLSGAPDVHGDVTGTVLPDGTATLTFSTPPLASSDAIRTSGGCPNASETLGPYTGRITKASLSLRSRFRLNCAGLPFPAPPAFDIEYQIEAAR